MKNIIILLAFAILSLQAQVKNVTLVLPWKHQFQFAGYYMAKEKGFYKELGLNLNIKEFDLTRDNAKDVASGKYEFGIGHSSLILDKINKYSNLKFLATIHQSSPLVLLSKKRDDLQNIEDIKDKKIMMSEDQVFTASINAMLFSKKIKLDNYKVIKASFNPIDLINGNADLMVAYISNEPFVLNEKDIKYKVFNPKDYGYDFYSDIIFTSSDMIKNNPKDVEAFYKATMMGWIYAYEHINESVNVILKHYNTQSRSKKALIYEAQTLKKLAFQDGVEFGNINPLRLKEIATTYRLLGLIDKDKKPNFNEFIYKLNIEKSDILKNKREDKLLSRFYKKYKIFIILFLLFLCLMILGVFYFRYKVKLLLKEQSKELAKNYDIFNKNISSSKTDINGKIIYASEEFCRCSGYAKEELIGNTHQILKDDSTPKSIYEDLWLTISSGHVWKGELKNIKKDSSECWVDSIISPIFDKNNKIIAYESIRKDITLKKVLQEFNTKLENEVKLRTAELEKIAITDKLTGLYNRNKIDKELYQSYSKFLRYDKVYSVLLIDIDHFKNINDTYGHHIGDDVLQKVSSIMGKSIRVVDILGRWGGEEFLVLSDSTDIDGAYILGEKIRSNIEKTSFDEVDKLTVSIGVAEIKSSMEEKDIIIKVDEALYRAKNNGRNRVEK